MNVGKTLMFAARRQSAAKMLLTPPRDGMTLTLQSLTASPRAARMGCLHKKQAT
ncbi:hypothetical protein [Diaphorobacter aerolatus]|uniref:Uncharacterized protein n=1 Tax=Diaphorobacter aerolatus TaxID=1288495 RepID=A0A7H0GHA8_9BURK|nr:hypothetical protein [Diaphorobacter aerolatus]QNP47674.1 hypothetical protein H9K75_15855 [Diaphorobacter aerolatus]